MDSQYWNSLDTKFLKSPLKEVVFEIEFPTRLRLKSDAVALQEAIGEDYPIVDRVQEIDEDSEPGLTKVNYLFLTPDRSKQITLTENTFGLSLLAHKEFEITELEIQKQTKNAIQTLSLKRIESIGLRYINKLVFERKKVNDIQGLKEYIQPYFSMQMADLRVPDEISTNFISVKDDLQLSTTTSLQLDDPEKIRYFIDIDAYLEVGMSPDEFDGSIIRLHKEILDVFLNSVTESYKKNMRTGEIEEEEDSLDGA